MTGSGVRDGDGVGVGEGDGDAVDPGAWVEAPSMEGFAEGSGEGVGAALPAPGEAVGEGEGEPWGSWASALVAATRLRTLKTRARTIPGKGNTEPEPVPHIRIPELE